MAPEPFKAVCAELHRELNRLRSEESTGLAAQRAELDRLRRRTRKLVELITEDDAAVKALKADLRTLEARETELESALSVARLPALLIHPSLAEVYRQKVAALHKALRDPLARDEAFDTIRSLIEVVRLVPADGKLRVEIKREFGAILAISQGANEQKTDREGRAMAEQIKMVAGARNHLYRTRVTWIRCSVGG